MPSGKTVSNLGLVVASSDVIFRLVDGVGEKKTATGVIGDRAMNAECPTARTGNALAIFRRGASRLLHRRCHSSMFIFFRRQRHLKMSQPRSNRVRSRILFTRWLVFFCR